MGALSLFPWTQGIMGRGYKYRWSFTCLSASHLLLHGLVPNRPWLGTIDHRLVHERGLGTSALACMLAQRDPVHSLLLSTCGSRVLPGVAVFLQSVRLQTALWQHHKFKWWISCWTQNCPLPQNILCLAPSFRIPSLGALKSSGKWACLNLLHQIPPTPCAWSCPNPNF